MAVILWCVSVTGIHSKVIIMIIIMIIVPCGCSHCVTIEFVFLCETHQPKSYLFSYLWLTQGSEEEEEELFFELSIQNQDERFGFSVMGGMDEGFLPKVDEIIEGNDYQLSNCF